MVICIFHDLERFGFVEKLPYYTFLGWAYFMIQDQRNTKIKQKYLVRVKLDPRSLTKRMTPKYKKMK